MLLSRLCSSSYSILLLCLLFDPVSNFVVFYFSVSADFAQPRYRVIVRCFFLKSMDFKLVSISIFEDHLNDVVSGPLKMGSQTCTMVGAMVISNISSVDTCFRIYFPYFH